MTKASEAELTVWQRSFAAGTSSGLSAILCNPLEVVKTRMQTDLAHSGKSTGVRHLHRPAISGSTFGTLGKIARAEGVYALWRGTEASLLITVPLIALYLPLYDNLLQSLQGAGAGVYSPLLAGSGARAFACMVVAPLELLKTRLQGRPQDPKGRGKSAETSTKAYKRHVAGTIGDIRGDMQGGPFSALRSLWRGVGATLAKDVPFAALFWMLLEPMRHVLEPDGYLPLNRLWSPTAQHGTGRLSSLETATVNAVAGSVAGGLAAGITTPFDVIKTHLQTTKNLGRSHTMLTSASRIVQRRGLSGLFLGVKPRAMRVALSYSILMSSYEVFKSAYARQENVPTEFVSAPTPAPQDSAPAGAPSIYRSR
ncbi:hypothetical protein WJX74_002312 [Apatococcus lobatus]|uniref:Mitochondrial carrier protein n=1 Tax=Apatococcus lobatus TaxID=904363 RepID=A0AAW1RKN8_9CHLO